MHNKNYKLPSRAVIYCKDIENITGRKENASQRLMSRIRKRFGKKPEQFVTVKEFSVFTGIDEETVYLFIT